MIDKASEDTGTRTVAYAQSELSFVRGSEMKGAMVRHSDSRNSQT